MALFFANNIYDLSNVIPESAVKSIFNFILTPFLLQSLPFQFFLDIAPSRSIFFVELIQFL